MLPGAERAFVAAVQQHKSTSPAHLFRLAEQLNGEARSLLVHMSDDPALACYDVRDACLRMAGVIARMERVANAIIDCDPRDLPERGATCRN